jgi:tRNA1(Val) A37 N6-methylase TrmN6
VVFTPAGLLDLDFGSDGQREQDIAAIHHATGFYTVVPEIEALLDRLGWPSEGERLLDPGAGNGGFLVAALRRLDLDRDDITTAVRRVRGYEFYRGAVAEARAAVRDHLAGRGWSAAAAQRAALLIVEERDFLLSPVPAGEFDLIAANPPYWRLVNLPTAYRIDYEAVVEPHARADMLFAYLQQSANIVATGGRIGLITADRWLLNEGSAELRRRLGRRFRVTDVHKLDAESAFYHAKERKAGTAPRVTPVSLILTQGKEGRALDGRPFQLDEVPVVDGVPLPELARIRLAPWLGPDGIFLVDAATRDRLPAEYLFPAVEPGDIGRDDVIRETRRWVIRTTRGEPSAPVLAHLDSTLGRMPKGGRRVPRWLPPEPFAGKLPVDQDAVLVPRIATHLRAIRLPAGVIPANHQLVVVSGLPVPVMIAMLTDAAVQAQADALSRRVDGGYQDYTAKMLRQLVIPRDLVEAAA